MNVSLDTAKLQLESFYAQRHEEKDIVGTIKDSYDELMVLADNEINQFTGSIKSIKSAMVPHLANIYP